MVTSDWCLMQGVREG